MCLFKNYCFLLNKHNWKCVKRSSFYILSQRNVSILTMLRFWISNPNKQHPPNTPPPTVTWWPLCHCSTRRPLVASHSIRCCYINAVIYIGIAGVKWYTVGLIARGGWWRKASIVEACLEIWWTKGREVRYAGRRWLLLGNFHERNIQSTFPNLALNS